MPDKALPLRHDNGAAPFPALRSIRRPGNAPWRISTVFGVKRFSRGSKVHLSEAMAFKVTMSFRMTAVMTSLLGLPFRLSLSAKSRA